ncbi:hypothetical protein [Lentilactobacillus hilgardii]|jgi:hypothetical protein|uniref:Uncharacterized protein n=1 Tax=Lentilactobacillus hilgardii (strain ATCC 8290 / DSM 20176 / CCUG 30140 / JCM 1155 / KCTC 3500 / NBRC 15886 / NCIMB 8040 / NRRL B-1843 / 9) TaxID=1423757 RepID=C0XKA4_LENH9|nr:hypothetical protein [Lentilactobacillus hilgardii]EEI24182.1 hypothetical protein HMPREF0519_1665 [Lentilactobacillus hilgardii DSM 20176 = ATCC 8290]KRK53722.1 hypothetical protein FD42_GL001647 [Lentilactobacillus hilgardii DSM 20176 = ATCC 8290]MCP9333905.1 hypothetical protein [Lentilactobacillus hilgardii]MCP9350504.1 hypothetical protein [Lentilactobacillus hilgardii]MCP9353400.1 hypothetical protein [Lentilactobacillus hilgardii]
MKLTKILGLSVVSIIFGVGYQSLNVNASTWHFGTPTFLRGHWQTRTISTPIGKDKSKASFGQHTIIFNSFGSMPDKFKQLRWHQVHKYIYSIKAKEFIDGYQKIHHLTIRRTSRHTIYIHLDGHKYPATSSQDLFHRVN